MNECILITAIGSMAAKTVIQKLKDNYHVIGCDIYEKKWVANATEVIDFYQVPRFDDSKYLTKIIDICKLHNVKYLIPLTDYEIDVFNINRGLFLSLDITLCISSKNTIDLCRNKKDCFDYLSTFNLPYCIDTDYVKNLKEVVYPIVIKPVDGRSSQGLHFVKDSTELSEIIKQIDHDKYIYQRFYKGNIVTCDVCRDDISNKTICVSREELLRTYNGAGLSVRVFNDFELNDVVCKIANILNVRGCVNFEFIKNDDGYKFIECNPRFSGGIAFSCLAGYDFVNNSLNVFKYEDISDIISPQEMFIAKRYEEVIC